MLVASNTSPICNLAIIGRLDLLRTQFHEILIPEVVKTELDRLSHADASRDIQEALRAGWIKIQPIGEDKVVRLLKATLDPGEAEAIALALEISADLILLDERDGRVAAERAGLRVTGVLGILLRAKKDGYIQSVKSELDSLRAQARFFVSPPLERTILEYAGE
jgi:predicted nucleic acid-binding protein